MITPNKFIRLDDSILSRLDIVLAENLEDRDVRDLYRKVGRHFDGVDEFLLTLDVLYILDRIDVDTMSMVVRRVG